jgi:hypothetical protein
MNLNKTERPEKKKKKENCFGKEHITQHKTVQKFDDP